MPAMRKARRRRAHATARWAVLLASYEAAFFGDDLGDEDGCLRDLTCRHCSGTGGDPWNDGITPCEHCDGEGYEWWN